MSIDGNKVEIDPKNLYQRLLVAGIGNIEPQVLFQYELCSYPLALFDTSLLMRAADKASLQNGLIKKASQCVLDVSTNKEQGVKLVSMLISHQI